MKVQSIRYILSSSLRINNATSYGYGLNFRKFSTSVREHAEVEIPVPWGHIAAKWWGPRDRRPIIGCHGWQDNCGTFDRLVPYLPSDVGFLAIDFPGHGRSSRIPAGINYNSTDFVILLRRLIEYFNWSRVSLMGHSLGAIQIYLYSVLFPETVDFLICIDCFHPNPTENYEMEKIRKMMISFLKYDKFCVSTAEPPSYTPEKLAQLWHEGSHKSVALENCKYILERNTLPSKLKPNEFYFTRDPRTKVGIPSMYSKTQIVEQARRVKFPMCFFKANDSVFYSASPLLYELKDIIQGNNQNSQFIEVGGTHHVHLNNPERVGPHVYKFIKTHSNISDEKSREIA